MACQKGSEDNAVQETSRRDVLFGLISSTTLATLAWSTSSKSAEAVSFGTLVKVIQDPSLLLSVMNADSIKRAQTKLKLSLTPIKDISAAQAESYTVEYDDFVAAVRKAGKAKINGEIVENPSEEQLLQAWQTEELRRALDREKKGEEPMTRAIRVAKEDGGSETKYLPPVITKDSTPDSLALAKHLKSIGATMYGAYWCSHCYDQKQLLGREAVKEALSYVECDRRGANNKRDMCKEKKVPGFPTWEINGELYPGQKSLDELAKLSGLKK